MKILDAIPSWVWAAALASLAATSCKLKVDKDGVTLELEKTRTTLAQAEAMYEAERADAATALAEAQIMYRENEEQLNKVIAAQRKEADEKIAIATARADAIHQRLRYTAAERDKAVAANSSLSHQLAALEAFAPGSLGAELSGQAGDLVAEAERAEIIRQELLVCYAAYGTAEQTIEKVKSELRLQQTSRQGPSESPR